MHAYPWRRRSSRCLGDVGAADEPDYLNARVVHDGVDGLLIAVYHLEDALGQSRSGLSSASLTAMDGSRSLGLGVAQANQILTRGDDLVLPRFMPAVRSRWSRPMPPWGGKRS